MANRFWVGGTGTWNATVGTKWATTSGGAGGASVPISTDDVFFDANSGINAVTFGSPPVCNNLNFTGFAGSVIGNGNVSVSGNLVLGIAMTDCNVTITMNSITSQTIMTNGVVINNTNFILNGVGGSWTLQDNFTSTNNCILLLTNGTLNLNNFDINIGFLSSTSSNTRGLNMGSGTVTLTSSTAGTRWSINATGMTLSAGTSTVKITGALTGVQSFSGGSLNYNNLWINTTGSFGASISGNNTFNDVKVDGGQTISFTAGSTQTVSSVTSNGSPGNLVVMNSLTSGSQWTISKSSGTINISYVSLQDSVATGGATWNAISSTNVSNNSGWNFIVGNSTIANISSITGITSIQF